MIAALFTAGTSLVALIGGAELLTILAAARDSDAGRRFRLLNGKVVGSVIDAARNARWHRAGAVQRAAETLLLAVCVVAVAHLPWSMVAAGWAVAGGWSWRRFDAAFARRFGQDEGYLGTTAATDRLRLGNVTMRRMGTAVALAGAVSWLMLQ